MNTQEDFKDIPCYDGLYQVSNKGNVKSLNYNRTQKYRNLKLTKDSKTGYLVCCLYKNKKSKKFAVHQIVAMAFLNHEPNGLKLVVNHKNFIRTDNRLENLEIVTARENTNQKHLPSISNYTGVFFNKKTKKWFSGLTLNSKNLHLGSFESEHEASEYYKNALIAIDKGDKIVIKKCVFSSAHKYISFDKSCKRWRVGVNGLKAKNFKTEKEAVEYRDSYLKIINK